MRLLLDANSFLWWVSDPGRLTNIARDAIEDDANAISVGIGSLWELTIKRALKKLEFPADFETVLRDEAFELLPIAHTHLRSLEGLPLLHRDPFDRLLIAQSLSENIPVVTNDRKFAGYGVSVVW